VSEDTLVSVENLKKHYTSTKTLPDRLFRRTSPPIKAVDGVSFEITAGKTLGLVGESGCGKSTTGETILALRSPTGGTVKFDGKKIGDLSNTEVKNFRRRTGMVFQDPFASLNPRMTAGQIIREPLSVHDVGTQDEQRDRSKSLLKRVGLSADQYDRYPHEFSGGQQQRIAIARALAVEPDFLVLDEPVSALDVSVQAQILNLLADLQTDFGLAYLFIAHDLSVVRYVSDRVAVMYLGNIAEIGPTEAIFERPQHPYTKALLESVPRARLSESDREITTLEDDVPSPRNPPSGCRFRTRCPVVIPPTDIDIDQTAYREVMDLRERIEAGTLTATDVDSTTSNTADAGTPSQQSMTANSVWPGEISSSLHGDNAVAVKTARAELRDGNRQAAIETLRDRFETVCEHDRPEHSNKTHHSAACHLRH